MSIQNSDAGLVREFKVDQLAVRVFDGQESLGTAAAFAVSEFLSGRISECGQARVILATGNSQITFLKKVIALNRIDWSKVTLFHMDEYLGIRADHKASFRCYLKERVETLVHPKAFEFIDGDTLLPLKECERYTALLRQGPIDLCCLGIGENGHIAFNDPSVADFDDAPCLKIVKLDDDCKMQQVREGHFTGIEAVPPYAFTLTISALCSAEKMICIAPETRKAKAVEAALQGPISTQCPASYLRRQPQAVLLLDNDSARGLAVAQ
jgi:glucosamine-6-phosphate deaminase